jgi:hypothetical protein
MIIGATGAGIEVGSPRIGVRERVRERDRRDRERVRERE